MGDGVFSTAQLKNGGATDAQIRRAVAAGDLTRLRPGWYARRDADPHVVAAVRAGGVLGCVSALQHHGVWVAPGHDQIHVRGSKGLRGSIASSCRGVGAPPPTITAVDSPAYALGCAVRCMTEEHWIAACDSTLQSRSAHRSDIAAELGPHGRDLLARCDGRSQSGTESLVRFRLRALGFEVVVQPQIGGVGRVDLRVGKLLIECDSKAHHTSLENYRNDRRRDRAALIRGWLKMRFTYDDVVYGWDESLDSIRAITRPRRHRMRD
ncbi:Very-short-patch-repair endonuclease [Williamsia maris]|uniref:Very-short-patch-repair endonuclease n=2 Tax=Williamsia maris TaxID=72806 RepID=A0ABT1HH44_9NOCA|nr:Very-short-patch-repair endonuclease [Williamsia maris]